MAPLMGMSLSGYRAIGLSGYRKSEQGQRVVSGPAAMPLRVIATEPEAVKTVLVSRRSNKRLAFVNGEDAPGAAIRPGPSE
ncbi:hypothetical protein [Methylosinus sp. LW3]|uniref:hypothetical protein n=1 Tax=Methylosinus sp. LW3 TaxID=107635 RepID=UPI0018DCF62B|nr:hypothetical protein [Methylosinus sp. LW3]